MRFSPYIETFTGKKLQFLAPSEDQIDIVDIATALSRIPRFNGHTRQFYSVAEHCWIGARAVRQALGDKEALSFLLHDASEAYLCDIPSPLKALLPDYREIEDHINAVIETKYDVSFKSDVIKWFDIAMLSNEAHWLMPSRGNDWQLWTQMARPAVVPELKPLMMAQNRASVLYLGLFNELHRSLTCP